jgi:wyosine [tRNA(Phe)-imidazoG37] synthetase (radical SAM superfamily)
VKKRGVFAKTGDVLDEIRSLPDIRLDYITFSGSGESMLADNFTDAVEKIKSIRKEPVAVLTNSSLITLPLVRKRLLKADFAVLKLDAATQKTFKLVNKPAPDIRLRDIIKGIKEFKKDYSGRLALQIMFIDENRHEASKIANIAKSIAPDEVQINTPTRPCRSKPLPKPAIDEIAKLFEGMNVKTVYDKDPVKVRPLSDAETLKRRGK